MINRALTEAFAFSMPVVCAMVCAVMMLLDAYAYRRNLQEKRLRQFLAATYAVASLCWLGLVLYSVNPRAFIYYHTVFMLTLMFEQVMFYRFVSTVTGTGQTRRFGRLHWIVPLLLTAGSVINGSINPPPVKETIVYGDIWQAQNPWPQITYAATVITFAIYNTLYPLLNLRNIHRYRQYVVNYSSEAQRASLGWLTAIQLLILISVPVPLAGLLLNIPTFATSSFVWLGALPTFIFYIILCYNMLDDNYLIIQPDTTKEESQTFKTVSIDRKYFERYMREKKPYLNPNLRIIDLAAGLHTNRSYLSAFINKEFGMNFCRLINRCRLIALEQLRLAPENSDKDNMELVMMAGFSSYRNYLRVKQQEDKLSLLKVFER